MATDQAIIEANAEMVAEVRLRHRKDIGRARRIAMGLLGHLEQIGTATPKLMELGESVLHDAARPDVTESHRQAVIKQVAKLEAVTGLAARAQMLKALADALAKLIRLERQAYSMDSAENPDGDRGPQSFLAELLNKIDGAGTGLPPNAHD